MLLLFQNICSHRRDLDELTNEHGFNGEINDSFRCR